MTDIITKTKKDESIKSVKQNGEIIQIVAKKGFFIDALSLDNYSVSKIDNRCNDLVISLIAD